MTSEFRPPYCEVNGGMTTLYAEVCNRGLKTIGGGLPTVFYGGDPEALLCVAIHEANLGVGQCVIVSCTVDGEVSGKVRVEGNDDGMGGKVTVDCIDGNNGDVIDPNSCG